MRSKNGLIFGVINIVGNFATVFQDQAYWQRAVASRPATTVKAYLLGGLAWFAIPFTLATTLGLAAVALRGTPGMQVLTPADVVAGLPAAAAASALLGKSGAVALLVLLFLAVTSATSAELIAVSTILTYDVYKVCFSPAPLSLETFLTFSRRNISNQRQQRMILSTWDMLWCCSSHCAWAFSASSSIISKYAWVGSSELLYTA
jgi:Na+/proline symporter